MRASIMLSRFDNIIHEHMSGLLLPFEFANAIRLKEWQRIWKRYHIH